MQRRSESRRVLGTAPSMDNPKVAGPPLARQPDPQPRLAIACPICQESMESLGQLNRHLDDEHVEVTDAVSEIGVRSWFQKQLNKSAKMAPVAAVSKSLRIAEDFERNEDHDLLGSDANKSSDALVSTSHWQISNVRAKCNEDGCTRSVQSSRSINCRHCGKLFCSSHSMYQMRLSRSAIYEPHRGIWCRVCRGCYENRSWYHDRMGTCTDLTDRFVSVRRRQVDVVHLKSQMLERRMSKLLQGLAGLQESSLSLFGFALPTSSAVARKRDLEQSIVPWEDEKIVLTCPLCNMAFSLDRRKHHCRMCGRCVCGDHATKCSGLVSLNVDDTVQKNGSVTRSENVRICRECHALLFGISDHKQESQIAKSFQDHYDRCRQYREAIDTLMPRFQSMVSKLSKDEVNTKRDVEEMNRVKKCIIDSMAQVETLSSSMNHSNSETPTQQKLQNAIKAETKIYLQAKVLTLQTIASMTKKKKSSPDDHDLQPDAQNLSEQQELRDEIAMFTEQRYLLNQQAEDAKRRRKFEDLSSIQASIDEIDKELSERQKQLILWSAEV